MNRQDSPDLLFMLFEAADAGGDAVYLASRVSVSAC